MNQTVWKERLFKQVSCPIHGIHGIQLKDGKIVRIDPEHSELCDHLKEIFSIEPEEK